MIEKHIRVPKTARYYILGDMSRPVKTIWFVCHGYGQLAGDFLADFKSLDDGHTLIVAPEGLHRFYLRGGSRNPGASWMTSEDRLVDIKDYLGYLDRVYGEIIPNPATVSIQVNLLGFSQGAATATRWALSGNCRVDNLILLGGSYPPETDLKGAGELLKTMGLYLIFGQDDPYVSTEFIARETQRLEHFHVDYQLETFSGGHQVPGPLLAELLKK